MKLLIYTGLFAGSIVGSWLGALLDSGNWFGATSILLGAAGSLAGIWAGFKLGKKYFS